MTLSKTLPGFVVMALVWLKQNQDAQSCAWAAQSMNKKYPPESMPVHFMRDAASAFAVLALLQNEDRRGRVRGSTPVVKPSRRHSEAAPSRNDPLFAENPCKTRCS